MKTFIELDWLLIGPPWALTAHFWCQNRLRGPFGRPISLGVQPNTVDLI